MEIYKKILQKCKKENITIEELERNLKFGHGTIRKWKSSSPTVEKIKAVANYFHIGVSYFLEENEKGD